MKAIYAVLPYERERFVLSISPDVAPVILYVPGPKPDEPGHERIECARTATFTILSQANEAGGIAVHVCPEHVARLRALAASSAQAFDRMLATIQTRAPQLPADKLRAMGWYREQSALPNGGEFHYMPVIAIGHGVAVVSTVILLTDKQAIVVQAESSRLCGEGGSTFPLCADPKGALNTIGQRLLR